MKKDSLKKKIWGFYKTYRRIVCSQKKTVLELIAGWTLEDLCLFFLGLWSFKSNWNAIRLRCEPSDLGIILFCLVNVIYCWGKESDKSIGCVGAVKGGLWFRGSWNLTLGQSRGSWRFPGSGMRPAAQFPVTMLMMMASPMYFSYETCEGRES